MRINRSNWRGLTASGLASLCGMAGLATADDTELFITGDDPAFQCEAPNVLLIIDTSGSMDGEVETQLPWDPAETYEGDYSSDRIYYSLSGDVPDADTDDMFQKSWNVCQAAAGAFQIDGQFTGQFRGWIPSQRQWGVLDPAASQVLVECSADRGDHGDGSAGNLYIADGPSGPWASDAQQEPSWAAASNVTTFDGNWLNWNAGDGTVARKKIDIVKEATKNVVDSLAGINFGLMRFHETKGGPIIHAVEAVETSRDSIKSAVDTLPADGFTPLSETLYEAGQYYAQRLVDFGDADTPVSVPASRLGDGLTYASPARNEGQKNFVVLLTDGEPDGDTEADSKIVALPGFSSLVGSACDGAGDGACLDDMAEYMFKRDLRSTVDGMQNVVTYTIGFDIDLPLLDSTAKRGGGEYFLADDTGSLTQALQKIVDQVKDAGSVFTAPAIPVNAFNRIETLDDVFISVFESSSSFHWPGNLKKYRVQIQDSGGAGQPDTVSLVGQDGQSVVDSATGFFTETAFSFWSPAPDGAEVTQGGAASQLPDAPSRRLLTNIAGGNLSAAGNQVSAANAGVTANLIGAPAAERDRVIAWARGEDVLDENPTGDVRLAMGDPLHVQPVTVIYGGDPDAGNVDAVVFIATNDGYLHAVDADNGRELWAFIPARLLGRLFALFSDAPTPNKQYGLDGEIRAFVMNNDGMPGIAGDEKVILLFGMRRGGSGVFAIDVTNRNQPRLVWEIDNQTAGFADLGQTWSTPVVSTVKVGATDRMVALFAGGYDSGQDNRAFRTDTIGNAIYMVDVEDGSLIWSAGGPNARDTHDLTLQRMRFSIPATLRAADLTEDGRADRIYVGDMGGQLWRLDIVNGNPVGSLVEGGVLASLGAADLGANPPASEIRRFYNTPDVVPVITEETFYLSINIGSGYRAHPLDTGASDEFFALRDFRVFDIIDSNDPAYDNPKTRAQLVDITATPNTTLLATEPGWRLRMEDVGEKILGESRTFANTVFFNSVTPLINPNSCGLPDTLNRQYRVNVLDGRPLTNLDGSVDEENLETSDRFEELDQGGIAPTPVFLFPEGRPGSPVVCVGLECFDPGFDTGVNRTFWYENETD
jgi:type IV pilus assembly protein PilY1